MKKQAKSKHFIEKPTYVGGEAALKKFIYANLKYPKEALKKKIEGLVILRYGIDHKGKVVEVKVVSSLGYGCDEEASRVIGLLNFQVPKSPRKMKVLFHRTSRIQFKLPKAKSEINYAYVTEQKKPEKKEEQAPTKSKSYHYTIKY